MAMEHMFNQDAEGNGEDAGNEGDQWDMKLALGSEEHYEDRHKACASPVTPWYPFGLDGKLWLSRRHLSTTLQHVLTMFQ